MNSGIILDTLLFVYSSFWSFFCFIWKKKTVILYTQIYILLSSLILSNPSSLLWRTATHCKIRLPFHVTIYVNGTPGVVQLTVYAAVWGNICIWVPEFSRQSETSPWAIYLNYNLGLKGSANQPWLQTSNILVFRC